MQRIINKVTAKWAGKQKENEDSDLRKIIERNGRSFAKGGVNEAAIISDGIAIISPVYHHPMSVWWFGDNGVDNERRGGSRK